MRNKKMQFRAVASPRTTGMMWGEIAGILLGLWLFRLYGMLIGLVLGIFVGRYIGSKLVKKQVAHVYVVPADEYGREIKAIATIAVSNCKSAYQHLLPADFLRRLRPRMRELHYVSFLERERCGLQVALSKSGEVVGFIAYSPDAEREGTLTLDDLHITSEFQNNGIGTRLIQSALDFAREQDYEYLSASVIKGNDRAKALLEHTGAAYQGEITNTDTFEELSVTMDRMIWRIMSSENVG